LKYLTGAINVLHLGCGEGSLSYSLATLTKAQVISTDYSDIKLQTARRRYHHPRLTFISASDLDLHRGSVDVIIFTDLTDNGPAWKRWNHILQSHSNQTILAQLTPAPVNWRDLHTFFTKPDKLQEEIRRLLPECASLLDLDLSWGMILTRFKQEMPDIPNASVENTTKKTVSRD
jgi:hypothetical protein